MVDVVTSRRAVLHDELLDAFEADETAPRLGRTGTLWAAAYRPLRGDERDETEIWVEPLAVGAPLPDRLPLWIDAVRRSPSTSRRRTARLAAGGGSTSTGWPPLPPAMVSSPHRAEALALFREIQAEFPHLRMQLDEEPEHVDVEMHVPEQPEMKFAVTLQLQGDELHLVAGALWVEAFPCHWPSIVERYREWVRGLLSGRYRVVEFRKWGRAVKAKLQAPRGQRWLTVAIWIGPGGCCLVPIEIEESVLQNREPTSSP